MFINGKEKTLLPQDSNSLFPMETFMDIDEEGDEDGRSRKSRTETWIVPGIENKAL